MHAARWELPFTPLPDTDGVALSDVLLVRRLAVQTEAPATSWRELTFEPVPAGALAGSDSIGVVFELYGLEPDDDGLAHYQVRVELADTGGRSLAARALGALGRLLGEGRAPEPALSWERTAIAETNRVVEYFVLVPESLAADLGELRITVRDLQTGREAEVTAEIAARAGG